MDWLLLFMLLPVVLIIGALVVFLTRGSTPFIRVAERVLGQERWERLAARMGRKPSDDQKEEKPKQAKPTRLPPAPKREPAGDSRDAAAQSLRKFFRNMR